MNICINKINSVYTNKKTYQKTNINKDKKFNTEDIDYKKIDDEEETIMHELYDKSVMIHSAFTYEEFKKVDIFPPMNCPGIVRREWRNLFKNASERQRIELLNFAGHCHQVLKETKMQLNDIKDYLKLMEEVKKYFKINYYNPSGKDNEIYESLMNINNNFEISLKQYI